MGMIIYEYPAKNYYDYRKKSINKRRIRIVYMEEKKEKWYFKTSVFIIALLCVGPIALPLLWFNPRVSIKAKILTSIIVVVLTYFLIIFFNASLKTIADYYSLIKF